MMNAMNIDMKNAKTMGAKRAGIFMVGMTGSEGIRFFAECIIAYR
jgi:hypothetical protein